MRTVETLDKEFITFAARQTGRKAAEITSLRWSYKDGHFEGLVEIDGENVRIGGVSDCQPAR